jgi:hypothetical protein
LKRNHPDLTFDRVKALITPNNFAEVNLKLQVLSGLTSEETAKKKLLEIADSTQGSSTGKGQS